MDRLQSMRTFVKVVDEGSFVAAARDSDVTPGVVTRLVADLEEHLGVRLLHRTPRRLALTGAGELYLARTRSVLADIEEAEALASTSSLKPCGRVRVLAPPSFSSHQLVKHLPRFRSQYPDIAVDLSNAGPIEVADEAYDISILVPPFELEHGDFVAHRLAATHLILCASPEYLSRRGVPRVPDDLSSHQSLEIHSAGQPRSWSLRRTHAADDAGVVAGEQHPSCVLSAELADTLLAAAHAGLGIASLPSFIVEDALASGTLVRVLGDWHLSVRTVYAAMPTRRHVPARTRAFMDFLVSTFMSPGDPWLRSGPPG
jgi:DNA-binding transcriptional LysR family regulator